MLFRSIKEGFVDASPLNESVAAPYTAKIMDGVRALMESGSWDVFSGIKLSYEVTNGTVNISRTAADLVDNQGNVIVAAGGPSVDDGVIKGSMDYNVAGVIEG